MNDYYQFAILSAVVVAVYAFLYFVVHPLAKWIAIKTPNKFDDLLVKKKVISGYLLPRKIISIRMKGNQLSISMTQRKRLKKKMNK